MERVVNGGKECGGIENNEGMWMVSDDRDERRLMVSNGKFRMLKIRG